MTLCHYLPHTIKIQCMWTKALTNQKQLSPVRFWTPVRTWRPTVFLDLNNCSFSSFPITVTFTSEVKGKISQGSVVGWQVVLILGWGPELCSMKWSTTKGGQWGKWGGSSISILVKDKGILVRWNRWKHNLYLKSHQWIWGIHKQGPSNSTRELP